MAGNLYSAVKAYFKNYFDMSADLDDHATAVKSIIDGVSFKGTNIVILIIATFIASLGLNTTSAAVIIGAMLVSPLMGPIIGIGLGVGIYDFDLIKRSFRNLAMAAGFSVIASTVYFAVSPVSSGHSELLARTSPTIYDVFIGFFGGAAGIVALSSKHKGNVLPGVAIATALMPPLCTAGYGLGTLNLQYFFGAFYLFLINCIFIAFATTLGVKFLKFPRKTDLDPVMSKKMKRIIYAIIILTMAPSIWLTINMWRENAFVSRAESFVEKEFVFPNTKIISKEVKFAHGEKFIKVSLIGDKLDTDSLRTAMQAKLVKEGIDDVQLEIEQGVAFAREKVSVSGVFNEIYATNMAKINAQSHQIDSLNAVISKNIFHNTISTQIAPEIKAIFPQISDIALSSSVFCNVATNQTDTVNIAMLRLSANFPAAERKKFCDYLEARTSLRNIRIVEATFEPEYKANTSAE